MDHTSNFKDHPDFMCCVLRDGITNATWGAYLCPSLHAPDTTQTEGPLSIMVQDDRRTGYFKACTASTPTDASMYVHRWGFWFFPPVLMVYLHCLDCNCGIGPTFWASGSCCIVLNYVSIVSYSVLLVLSSLGLVSVHARAVCVVGVGSRVDSL